MGNHGESGQLGASCCNTLSVCNDREGRNIPRCNRSVSSRDAAACLLANGRVVRLGVGAVRAVLRVGNLEDL